MQTVRGSPAFGPARGRQRGQALIFGLFVLISGLAALFFFFNVGQLSREKTKLVNTADAVAYSAGVMQARALNFTAYGNRALIANEVFIAQMVSVSSWAQYVGDWTDNVQLVHYVCPAMAQAANGNWVSGIFGVAAAMVRFDPLYAGVCAALSHPTFANVTRQMTDLIPTAAGGVVTAAEVNKLAIVGAQNLILNPAVLDATRRELMQGVANANYAADGQVTIAESMLSPELVDDWFRGPNGRFVRQYAGAERTRFREVTLSAAYTDNFVRQRNWTSQAVLPEPECLAVGQWVYNQVRRRGGTELLGFDQWQAIDTQSYHYRYRGKMLSCRRGETQTAATEQEAYQNQQDASTASFGGSRASNPQAHASALDAGTQIYTYSGLPNYYDLNDVWISGANRDTAPTMRHAVRLSRARGELRTTDGGNGQIRTRADSRIGAYNSAMAANEMDAISTVEVYFERPPSSPLNSGRRELGSLFNPYWQVRLTNSDAAVAAVIARKGLRN